MFARPARLLSNKENSTFPLTLDAMSSTSASKPRVTGIGRAPYKRSHGSKPYARVPSIQRAKANAVGAKKATTFKSSGGMIKQKPAPILVRKSQTRTEIQPARMARIPMRLPRPVIPPVISTLPSLENDAVPPSYVLARLAPQLPAILVVTSLYRPYPHLNLAPLSSSESGNTVSSSTATQASSSRPRTMAFGVPQLMESKDEALAAKVRGREPDMCLAIKQKGTDGPCRLFPVNQLVYAAQCSYWPARTASATPSPPPEPTDQENAPPPDTLETIDEELDPDSSFSSISSVSTKSSNSCESTCSSSCPQSPSIPASFTTPDGALHLPFLPLALPSASTFPLLHTHLHLPSRPWLPALLSLSSTCTTRQAIVTALVPFSTPELMGKLEVIHGVWQNLCALGVASDATWAQLGEAWGCVVGVIAGRAMGIERMDTTA